MSSGVFQGFRRGGCLILGSQITNVCKTRAVPLIRNFATKTGQESSGKKSNFGLWATLAAVGIGGGGGYYYWSITSGGNVAWNKKKCGPINYQDVYNSIAEILDADYDDGSYGPILLRLAWHSSGTYDKNAKDGGSNKATMRHEPEASHGGNKGLQIAREKLETIKKKYPQISYGDLWTLAGVCAIQEMGGPIITWRPGRIDGVADDCTPDGRLPDGGNPNPQHSRDIFYRQGFNDQEIVALLGAHAVGRCHTDRSGFDGPWTNSPTTFTNSYYIELLGRKWIEKNWKGPKQFIDKESGELMMLPADVAYLNDKEFKKWVEIYSKDEKKFFDDFANVWKKMIENGVNFKDGTPEYKFKPT